MAFSPASIVGQGDVRSGVKTGKAQYEQMFSALPPKADITRCGWHVRKVPRGDIDERPHTQHTGCKFVNAPAAKQNAISARSRQAQPGCCRCSRYPVLRPASP